MKKRILVWSLIFIMMVLIPITVFADSFRFGMTASKTTLNPGDTVTISFSVNDINAGEQGINTVEGFFSYDNNVFEEVTSSNFIGSNGWSITYNGESSTQKGKVLAVLLQSGTKTNQEIGKVTLKVKSNIDATSTTVTMKDIATNNGSELISDTNKSVTLTVQKASNNDNNSDSGSNSDSGNSGSSSNNGSSSNSGNSSNSSNSSNSGSSSNSSSNKNSSNSKSSAKTTNSKSTTTTKSTKTTSKVKLPYTGSESYIIAIMAAVSVCAITYVKYKKYKTIIK